MSGRSRAASRRSGSDRCGSGRATRARRPSPSTPQRTRSSAASTRRWSEAFSSDALWIPDRLEQAREGRSKDLQDPGDLRRLARGAHLWVVSAGGWIWAGAAERLDRGVGGRPREGRPGDRAGGQPADRAGPGAVRNDDGRPRLHLDQGGRRRPARADRPKTGEVKTFDLSGFEGLTQLYDMWPATGLGSVWVRLTNDTVVTGRSGDRQGHRDLPRRRGRRRRMADRRVRLAVGPELRQRLDLA